jgi:gliding motility-associated-like protein
LSINSQTGYSFQWIKDGVDLAGQTGTTLNVTLEGSYKVRVTNIALSCSQETTAVAVTVYTTPTASFTIPATGCVNSAISFTDTSTKDSRATTTFTWTFGDSNTSTAQNPTHTYTAVQAFNPQLTISYTGVTGCSNNTTKNISIVAAQTPAITASLPEICPTEVSTLSVAGTFATYQWNTSATTASIDVSTPGDYSVTTTDANGCVGNASITLTTKSDCPTGSTILEFPLVFTPNGDVQNDRWVIPGIENYNECTMNIFDGRGRRVFQVTGYPVEGWDGTFDGKEVPEGTYYFVFGCPAGTPSSGSVLIVR